MFAGALQKVFEIRHRNIPYLFAKHGIFFPHHLAESIVAHLRQIGVFQMLQGLLCRILPLVLIWSLSVLYITGAERHSINLATAAELLPCSGRYCSSSLMTLAGPHPHAAVFY